MAKIVELDDAMLTLGITRDKALIAVQMEDQVHGVSLSMRLTPDKARKAAMLLEGAANDSLRDGLCCSIRESIGILSRGSEGCV